jgi:two-component sensor histidine kinase
LTFRDDGPGWPEDVLAGRRQNIGLELVRMSAIYTLGGEITLANEGGAMAVITFRPASLDE